MLSKNLLDGDEVLQALGHLAPSNRQVARVEEVPGSLRLCCGCVQSASNIAIMLFQWRKHYCHSPGPAVVVKVSLALSQLVVMVGKLQVITATKDTEW